MLSHSSPGLTSERKDAILPVLLRGEVAEVLGDKGDGLLKSEWGDDFSSGDDMVVMMARGWWSCGVACNVISIGSTSQSCRRCEALRSCKGLKREARPTTNF